MKFKPSTFFIGDYMTKTQQARKQGKFGGAKKHSVQPGKWVKETYEVTGYKNTKVTKTKKVWKWL
jgi:hypothetical protein